ncbi:MAG: glycosyltransferase family 4 protein [Parvularculaceae bacterium]
MNILYSHRTKSADGQYVHIRSLTDALALRGHAVFMAGPDDFGTPRTRPLDATAGAGGFWARLPRPLYELGEIVYSTRGYLRLRAATQAFDPDILYERYNLFYNAGVELAREKRLPFILEVNAPLAEERAAHHGGLSLGGLARRSERLIWMAADKVLPVSEALARLVAAAGVPREKIEVVRNGVDGAFLKDVDPRPVRARYGLEGKLVLGFAGFARRWHGLDTVVRYLAERGGDAHFLIVGDGEVRDGLVALAHELGVSERLTITGVVQREDLPAHVAAFDVALQPASTPYASPLKLFEYMALGRAIVAPASDNIREILNDGRDALLFAPGVDTSFFERLDALLADSELRARLGGAARANLLREDLTWAANAARVERVAQALLARGRRESRR